MFDDLVNNSEENVVEKETCDSKPSTVPSSNKINNIKPKVSNTGGILSNSTNKPPHTLNIPAVVSLDFQLAKIYMLDCFLKDSILEKTYLKKIADMLIYATTTQGLSIQNDPIKIAEMVLAEIFY